MGGYRLTIIVTLALTASCVGAQASGRGRAIYIHAASPADPEVSSTKPPNELWETDLNTNATRVLISYKALPKGMSSIGDSVSVDESGRFVCLDDWCWDRRTGTAKKVEWYHSWSAGGRYILMQHGYADEWHTEIRDAMILEPATCKKYRLADATRQADWQLRWSGKEGALFRMKQVDDSTIVYRETVTGRRTMLFKWPRLIMQIAGSADGRCLAIEDEKGLYLTNGRGRLLKRLSVDFRQHWYGVQFLFNRRATRLAILQTVCTGEPHVHQTQKLYCLDVRRRRLRLVNTWEDSFLGSGYAIDRSLLGWAKNDVSTVLRGSVSYGVEKPADSEHDWYRIWIYDMSSRKPQEVKLLDTGAGCPDLAWVP